MSEFIEGEFFYHHELSEEIFRIVYSSEINEDGFSNSTFQIFYKTNDVTELIKSINYFCLYKDINREVFEHICLRQISTDALGKFEKIFKSGRRNV
jgi:hypothetical protein